MNKLRVSLLSVLLLGVFGIFIESTARISNDAAQKLADCSSRQLVLLYGVSESFPRFSMSISPDSGGYWHSSITDETFRKEAIHITISPSGIVDWSFDGSLVQQRPQISERLEALKRISELCQ